MKKKVMIVREIHESAINYLKKKGCEVIFPSSPSPEVISKEINEVVGLIRGPFPCTKQVIDSAKNLVVIAAYGVGTEWIDIEAASKRGIYITNNPFANTISVAEHTIGFILALTKRLKLADSAVRNGNFDFKKEWPSIELDKKILGIIGAGNIGASVAKKCISAFNMQVLAYDPYLTKKKASLLKIKLCNLRKVLTKSDFISIHAPLTQETINMIGEEEFKLMKPTAFIINMARGTIIDEESLIKAIQKRWISGAALDVFSNEPPCTKNPLLSLDNIILSPHMAADTKESVFKMSMGAAKAVIDAIEGRQPKHIVNMHLLKKYNKVIKGKS